jgi:hypothetical protein
VRASGGLYVMWRGSRGHRRPGQTIRTAPPVDDFGLVDLVAPVIGGREAGSGARRAVDVDQPAADATDQMVMVVANSTLEPSSRPGGLNAPDEAFGDQHAEGVVHRLKRDGTDLSPDELGHDVGRDVGLPRDRPQDSQPLGGDLNTALAKELCRVGNHRPTG